MTEKYRIIHLEDTPSDAEFAARELKKRNIDFEHLVIDTESEYLNALETFSPDIILCDHSLPAFNSFEALKILRSKSMAIPFILITGQMSEEIAAGVVEEGADDYILKDRLTRLPNAVLNAIEKHRYEKERKQLINQAQANLSITNKLLTNLSDKLVLALKAAFIGTWEYDIHNNKFIADENMLAIYGTIPASFDDLTDFIHQDDKQRVSKELKDALLKHAELNTEFRIVKQSGTIRYINGQTIIERNAAGQATRIIGINQDITSDKEAELRIEKSTEEREILIAELTRSLNDLKQFTFITSHNFRAPLSNLIGLLSLINFEDLSVGNREIMNMFKSSTLQLNKTINDLIQVLIIKNNANITCSTISVNRILTETLNFFTNEILETGSSIVQDLQVEDITFNKSYFESVLINLISNAIKYRSPLRKLIIKISTYLNGDGDVVLSIEDNGSGIDLQRHKNELFGLYQRFHANAEGAGFGLFMVKSQVEALGATITVDSAVEEGTKFHITFKEKNRRQKD